LLCTGATKSLAPLVQLQIYQKVNKENRKRWLVSVWKVGVRISRESYILVYLKFQHWQKMETYLRVTINKAKKEEKKGARKKQDTMCH
jgi:hypothetical protein